MSEAELPAPPVQPSPGRLRPPVPGWAVALVLVPAVGILIGGDAAGRAWLAAAVILFQLVLVPAWLGLLGASLDAGVLVAAGVVVADVVVLRTDRSTGGSIVGVIGVGLVVVLLHQLALRHREEVTANVAANLSAMVLGAAPALLLPLRVLPEGRSVGYAALAAAGAAVLVARILGGEGEGRDLVARLGGLVVAAAIGVAIGAPHGGLGVGDALSAALASAFAALLVDRAFVRVGLPAGKGRRPQPSPRLLVAVSALAPIALATPIAYLAGRIIAPGVG